MYGVIRLMHEAATCFGSGILGLGYMLINENGSRIFKYFSFSSIGAGIMYFLIQRNRKKTVNERNVILITGCDSGLGFNMALYCNLNLNMFVCAACLNTCSEGAQKLLDQCNPKRLLLVELDIRKSASILHIEKTIMNLLSSDSNLEFSYLVNNAGVMCFGEFEWQTNAIIEHQINVNLFGTMNFTRSFLHLARKYKTRIINVTSHCAIEALPGLATYAATKAALRFWSDALRVEMKKYGVDVVNFIPGSQFMNTSIVSRQKQYASEMLAAFTDEQLEFYGDYFERYNKYLSYIPNHSVQVISDSNLFNEFGNTILDYTPRAIYKCEPIKYTIYHILFKYSPVFLRDLLIIKFVNMPAYETREGLIKQ
ncbi:D-beta-hydroxybutyrate dehydrogenase, mitochondrial isoform X2 [Sitodiplosis mosellana]|uniref:D-beta-hydroxybutyrate dehydrogenase, mitochondrial isoform X2 n=1 Tax=Sitodiplosis mosellana TaxID=263140 RepID=UPI002444EAE1|nr:D-beta-hydroxybutyrate dehydrogenase, mitochondrial isoform X2 [Sitodiplosis mosellana]